TNRIGPNLRNGIGTNRIGPNLRNGIVESHGRIQNNLIVGNRWGIYRCNGPIVNNTIVDNTNDDIRSCYGEIVNCIIGDPPSGVADLGYLLNCCVIEEHGWQGKVILGDPLFEDRANGDYRLSADSPCRDVGNLSYLSEIFQVDLEGNTRISGDAVDIGCYEFGSSYDSDGDFLDDDEEAVHGSDPTNRDTDGDGLLDGFEVRRGNDPRNFDLPRGIVVPTDLPTLDEAVAYALPSERVTVMPGTHGAHLFVRRDIELLSSDPLSASITASTILNGSNEYPILVFHNSGTDGSRIEGLTLANGRGLFGGAIHGHGTKATIRNNRFRNNRCSRYSISCYGGALYDCDGLIEENSFWENYANFGGALSHCDGTIRGNRFIENNGYSIPVYRVSIPGKGGALHACAANIVENEFYSNGAVYGGAISESSGVILSNTFIANYSERGIEQGEGGAIFDCDGWILHNRIERNQSFVGGGLAKCDGEIAYNIIRDNTAESYCRTSLIYLGCAPPMGGGLHDCDGQIHHNLIQGNRLVPRCGQLSCPDSLGAGLQGCDGLIENNIVATNDALIACASFYRPIDGATEEIWIRECSSATGGGIQNCEGVIRNNTFYGNRVEGKETGAAANCRGDFENNIVWGNLPLQSPQVVDVTPAYCLIQSWTGGGPGNLSENPRFTDPENGDYRLKPISPAVDAGKFQVDLITDFDREPRPFKAVEEHRGDGSAFDIGADEYRLFINPHSDLTNDLRVDMLDLNVMQRNWHRETEPVGPVPEERILIDPDTDLDFSGRVDVMDLALFLEDWGRVSE
ncbi:MAG: hypothetical protein KC964_22420, partial [Candidatus Omnitrophica bacterium]|nr:hypothetical protein [Candidatus Omnitrophota bacterium]